MSTTKKSSRVKTEMATLDVDSITVRGHNLVDELIGKIDIADLFFLEVSGKLPRPAESRLINAMVVAIAEHGMMPSVIAARLTFLGAPESLQGAVASGLLGAGDTFVGPSSNVAKMLQIEAAAFDGSMAEKAKSIVELYTSTKRRIPGLGQPHHPVDPRTQKLFDMQRELGVPTLNTELMLEIHRFAVQKLQRPLTLNAVAAIGAISSDIGLDWRAVRGIGLIARTVGLIGHVLEEIRMPQANAIWDLVQQATDYSDPHP
ncbi:citryl-CoA lyase [Microvirga antarctica]|uniref:citryl-CoA lyase n=1 Tax=Microvirga antarctica TaxID=2819233 RepID=UPI001B3040D9|nr:citryl-CoA lyase [Microvirga antarctica]